MSFHLHTYIPTHILMVSRQKIDITDQNIENLCIDVQKFEAVLDFEQDFEEIKIISFLSLK